MTKLFKNSKQVLAFVFAFAVLAVSLFTGSINITADACDTTKIDYWDGTKASSFASGTGTETDPYIIKTAEQLAYCCTGINPTNSTGKFYKVDDSVKIFVMQPESVVDLDTLMGLDSAEAAKDYLSGLSGKKDWSSLGASGFNGNFDGNGATIYGIWADGITTNKGDVGLFPRYDGGYKDGSGNVVANVCKNIAVKNSYFSSTRRIGVINGAAYGSSWDAKIDGITHYDTIAVVNCYVTSNANNINYYGEEALLVDGGSGDVSTFNNILLKGNYAYNTAVGKEMAAVLAATNKNAITDSNGNPVKSKISNSVILGSDPFRKDLYSDAVFLNVNEGGKTVRTFFDNVITDEPAGKITATNPAGWGSPTSTAEFTEEQIKQVTDTGFAFKAAASNLDWENTWFMSENGPELRKFHGEIKLVTTNETHVWECEDCGLTSPGGVADHDFVLQGDEVKGDGTDVYACSVCEYTCQHTSQSNASYDPGNCVTAPGTYSRCAYCDWYIVTDIGEVPGHDLTYVEAYSGHCEQDGHKAYWLCEECDNKFAAEDPDGNPITADDLKVAPFESAVSDADLNTGLGSHIKEKDEFGSYIVKSNKDGHWFICEIDGGKINVNDVALGENELVKHAFESARCKECGWICENHDYKETGKLAVIGDCETDEEAEIKCKLCGYKDSKVIKEAGHTIVKVKGVEPTDKMEGTKEHYICTVCNKIYSDAEGKTPVTKASLVIPKELPDEYKNPTYQGSTGGSNQGSTGDSNQGTTNTPNQDQNNDQSTTSPATGESVVAVAAVAALAGAAFVLTRKARR